MRKMFALSSLRLLHVAAMLIAAPRLGAQAVTQHRDVAAVTAGAAVPRPAPYPVFETPEFAHAVARGTRTRTGRPGAAYWQQHATYQIDVRLNPASKEVSGRETVTYVNNSPDTLRRVAVYLRQNLFAPGAVRNIAVPVTGGMQLRNVRADGQAMMEGRAKGSAGGYEIDGTVAWITLPRPLAPRGDTLTLGFTWHFTSPPAPADQREGQDGDVFMVGYWYPQLAVYDDVSGWVTDAYLGRAEFYMGYADYDVRVTVPSGWLVGSTGTLQNADDVLSPTTRDRLLTARRRCDVVQSSRPPGAVPGAPRPRACAAP